MEAEDIGETGETTQPGQGGDTADTGAVKAEGAETQEAGGEDADKLKGKLSPEVQELIDKRIGKLTAKAKTAAEERDALRAELDRIKAEKDEAEAAKFGHLPVMPEYLTPEARTELAAAERELAEAGEAEATWNSYAASEEGYTDRKTGRTYTPKQCAEFARQAAREAGKAEARKELVVRGARKRQEADLRELRARKVAPKPGAGAPRVTETPKTIAKQPGEGGGGGGAPARPADIDPGRVAADRPKTQADAKAWLND
jgi:hypothetical protein